jgi:hypothetical protein
LSRPVDPLFGGTNNRELGLELLVRMASQNHSSLV